MAYKNALIIGNGFDLDLGWNTRYSDYASGTYWPSKGHKDSMLKKLMETSKDLENWFDIEELCLEFAKKGNHNIKEQLQKRKSLEIETEYFNTLRENLIRHLQAEQQKQINFDSVAATILRHMCNKENNIMTSVFSFNYTDLHAIQNKCGITKPMKYDYIHGNLQQHSIILGVDETELIEGYEFLHKLRNPYYISHNISNQLLEAEEVVFFGVSFGQIDFMYFKKFFQEYATLKQNKFTQITIFTFNEQSRISIANRLAQLNGDILLEVPITYILTQKVYNGDPWEIKKYHSFCDRFRRKYNIGGNVYFLN